MANWKEIPIIESGEPLEIVTGGKLLSRSEYYKRGYPTALHNVWVRKDIHRRLHIAAKMLPDDLTLIAWDGWRPYSLQEELYNEYKNNIMRDTGLKGAALENEVRKFVSYPDNSPGSPSPHLTGGSIDVTLGDSNGIPLDMGGEYDELGVRSHTDYYEQQLSHKHNKKVIIMHHNAEQKDIHGQHRLMLPREEEEKGKDKFEIFRDRRRLLCSIMIHQGFSNYEEEWWHFDFGNQFHHARVGGAAHYSIIEKLSPDLRDVEPIL